MYSERHFKNLVRHNVREVRKEVFGEAEKEEREGLEVGLVRIDIEVIGFVLPSTLKHSTLAFNNLCNSFQIGHLCL